MIKEKRTKIMPLIAVFLIAIGGFINVYDYFKDYAINNIEKESVEAFIKNDYDAVPKEIKEKEEFVNYMAVLEIPSINLKKGLVDPNSYLNNVNYNIQILKPYSMPDQKKGNLILASHSGNARVGFFDNLKSVVIGDEIFIYYKNIKYTYKVINKYETKKDGKLYVTKDSDDTTLTLVTCTSSNFEKQLYVIAKQIKETSY